MNPSLSGRGKGDWSPTERARGLAELVWNAVEGPVPYPCVPLGRTTSAEFGGGFVGRVKAVGTEPTRKNMKLGIGAKWQPARRSYIIRAYQYGYKQEAYYVVAELELSAADSGPIFDPDDERVRLFLDTVADQLKPRGDP